MAETSAGNSGPMRCSSRARHVTNTPRGASLTARIDCRRFLWVTGFSFFHCVASPFHSFVTIDCRPCIYYYDIPCMCTYRYALNECVPIRPSKLGDLSSHSCHDCYSQYDGLCTCRRKSVLTSMNAEMYRRSGLVISREQGLRCDAGFAVPVLMS